MWPNWSICGHSRANLHMRYNWLKLNKSELCQTRLDMKYFQHICFYHWVKRGIMTTTRGFLDHSTVWLWPQTTDQRSKIGDQGSEITYQRSGISDNWSQQLVRRGQGALASINVSLRKATLHWYHRYQIPDIIDTRYRISSIPDIKYHWYQTDPRNCRQETTEARILRIWWLGSTRRMAGRGEQYYSWHTLTWQKHGSSETFVEKSCFGKEYSSTIANFWTCQVWDLKPPIIYFPLFLTLRYFMNRHTSNVSVAEHG